MPHESKNFRRYVGIAYIGRIEIIKLYPEYTVFFRYIKSQFTLTILGTHQSFKSVQLKYVKCECDEHMFANIYFTHILLRDM